MVVFLKMDKDSESIVWYYTYFIPAIASECPSQYIHHTREAGSKLVQSRLRIFHSHSTSFSTTDIFFSTYPQNSQLTFYWSFSSGLAEASGVDIPISRWREVLKVATSLYMRWAGPALMVSRLPDMMIRKVWCSKSPKENMRYTSLNQGPGYLPTVAIISVIKCHRGQ